MLGNMRRWYVGLALIVFNSIVLIVMVNLALYFVYLWLDHRAHTSPIAASFPLPVEQVYPNWKESDLEQLLRETRNRPYTSEEYTGFRERPFAGRYVRVTKEGYRISKNQGPWPPRAEYFNIFFLGGSTTFGYDLPDNETVPSFLQELLPEVDGKKTYVYNFGRSDYFSTNERILLEQLLISGLRPDMAIVMDGLNEFDNDPTAKSPASDTSPSPITEVYENLTLFRLVNYVKYRFKKDQAPSASTLQAAENDPEAMRIEATLARYVANKKTITAVAGAFGVAAAFVWHPVPTYRYDLSLHPFAKTGWNGLFLTRRGYQLAAEQVRSGRWGHHLVWCADLQASAREPLYVDKWHYTAKFSRDVAACVVQGLAEQKRVARQGIGHD
jgi:lysophospholipase L1-like esterase